jgi:hypothetical protein
VVSGPDMIAARRRALLEELENLDTSAHDLQVEQRRRDLIRAYGEERRAAEVHLRGVARTPGDERVAVPWLDRHDWPTAGERRAQLTEQIGLIDNEIARLEAEG